VQLVHERHEIGDVLDEMAAPDGVDAVVSPGPGGDVEVDNPALPQVDPVDAVEPGVGMPARPEIEAEPERA